MSDRSRPLSTQGWPGVWRGRSLRRDAPALPSGHAVLDRHLPGGGWPLGALTELFTENPGSGEFGLLLPTLARLTRQAQWVILVDPPWIPYPPAIHGHGVALERVMVIRSDDPQHALWACEQALHGPIGGAVLAWPGNPGFARLRRLQLAARSGQKTAFLFRPLHDSQSPSPAALRLWLAADPEGVRITVLKCQGRRPSSSLLVRHSVHTPGAAALRLPAPTRGTGPARTPDSPTPSVAATDKHWPCPQPAG